MRRTGCSAFRAARRAVHKPAYVHAHTNTYARARARTLAMQKQQTLRACDLLKPRLLRRLAHRVATASGGTEDTAEAVARDALSEQREHDAQHGLDAAVSRFSEAVRLPCYTSTANRAAFFRAFAFVCASTSRSASAAKCAERFAALYENTHLTPLPSRIHGALASYATPDVRARLLGDALVLSHMAVRNTHRVEEESAHEAIDAVARMLASTLAPHLTAEQAQSAAHFLFALQSLKPKKIATAHVLHELCLVASEHLQSNMTRGVALFIAQNAQFTPSARAFFCC